MFMENFRATISTVFPSLVGIFIGSFTFSHQAPANTLNIYDGGPGSGVVIDLTVSVNAGNASFLFKNNSTGAGAGSDVHEIWFESGLASLLKTPATPNAPGTFQASLTSPSNPAAPQGGLANWAGNLFDVGYDSQSGNANMISVGDAWAITFALQSNATTASDLLSAIFNPDGTSRIALHIGDCVGGESCWALVTGDTGGPGGGAGGGPGGEVPLPATAILFGSVIAGSVALARTRRRRRISQA